MNEAASALIRPAPARPPGPPAPHSGAAAATGNAAPQPDGHTEDEPFLPSPQLPAGGGAIRGMGEKFSVAPSRGTAALSVPLALSRGRSGVGPPLALGYDSGAGNSAFGLGFDVAVPRISRKTAKGVPRYPDCAGAPGTDERDVYLLSGAEDLVPALVAQSDGSFLPDTANETIDGVAYRIERYRPRVEGGFDRIERCVSTVTGDAFWRTVSRSNVTSQFGRSAVARVCDPADPTRVFEWLLEQTADDRGNVTAYTYKAEDFEGVESSLLSERHRLGGPAPAQRYLKQVSYGNRTPGVATPACFLVVFDYGEHDQAPDEVRPWPVRQDPFSSYRSGFEVRTWRLCGRILIFHTFDELGDGPTPRLVQSTDLGYQPDPAATQLVSVTHTSYLWDGAAYQTQSMPPLEFEYTESGPDSVAREVDLPPAPDPETAGPYWIDLDGEGIAGALTRTGGGWWYQRNLGGGTLDAPEAVPLTATLGLAGDRIRLADLAGDGRLSVIVTDPGRAGSTERGIEGDWSPFRPFQTRPALDFDDPGMRQTDLAGAGLSDVLIGEGSGLRWSRCLGRDGYGPVLDVVFDGVTGDGTEAREQAGPPLGYVDPTGSTSLANVSGDGLADVVRVRNGEVCYWPNLGHGRFGGKVTMDAAPIFDSLDHFDPRRVRWADIDGSGTADLLYLGPDGVRYWINRAGNGFGPEQRIDLLPSVDNLATLAVIDLLGTGTPCLVWSSPLPGSPVRYVDLARGSAPEINPADPRLAGWKPRLLRVSRTNTGAETVIEYASSTRFYLADRVAGTPWVTRLPFPVHVVAATTLTENVSGLKVGSSYTYRHGHYDGVEREYRGFGMVERTDVEAYTGPEAPSPNDLPPARARTWYYVGSDADVLTDCFSGDSQAVPLDGLDLDPCSAREYREALRAAAGQPLRTEIYADDATSSAAMPYSVAEHRYHVTRLQPARPGEHAVYHVYELESVSYQYERNPADPRIAHQATLEVDEYGNALSQVAVNYPRRTPAIPEQSTTHVVWSVKAVANTDTLQTRLLGTAVETRAFEVTGLSAPDPASGRYSVADLTAHLAAAVDVPFENVYTANHPSTSPTRRLLADVRMRYWADDLSAPLPLGQQGLRALPWQSYRRALTPGLLTAAYGSGFDASVLTASGGYLAEDGDWWIPTGVHGYDAAHFYLPTMQTSAFGNVSGVVYDAYDLLPVTATASQTAPFDLLTTKLTNDYRVLAPSVTTDANGNRRRVAFDVLGLVTQAWVAGKEGSSDGDPDALPGALFSYDPDAWRASGIPLWALGETRERHGDASSPWQRMKAHTDGLGRLAMAKNQAAPGLAWTLDSHGNAVQVDTSPNPRWVGTGRIVRNNKGLPVEKYEEYFSATSDYESADALVKQGVTAVVGYDPLGRAIRIDKPDGTLTRVEFDPWQRLEYDAGDTVLESRWYTVNSGAGATAAQQRAASLAAAYANTPATVLLDTLGRPVRARADNGPDGVYEITVELDPMGATLKTTDARGLAAATQIVDMTGRVLAVNSADAGPSTAVPDAAGLPLSHTDGVGNVVTYAYDQLRRSTETWVTAPGETKARLTDLAVYGEQHPNAVALNLLGLVHRRYDQAGLSIAESADFKGNLLTTSRRLVPLASAATGTAPDWSALHGQPLSALDGLTAALLDTETFTTSVSFDALNRPIVSTLPDGTRIQPSYDAGGLFNAVGAYLGSATSVTSFVDSIDHDAKGQRLRIAHANGATTALTYDPESFRLTGLETTVAGGSPSLLQSAGYTYDSVGNIVELDDSAAQTAYFAGAVAAPGAKYTYDPVYRLRSSSGREHASLGVQPDDKEPQYAPLPHPNDAQAIRPYTETYTYDAAGNILSLAHAAGTSGTWTRRYTYDTASDRLLSHTRPSDPPMSPGTAAFVHDANGRMTTMPHLPGALGWDHADRFVTADLGGGGTAAYVYDAVDARVRRIVGHSGGLVEERIYLGAFELYRRYQGTKLIYERRTVHITDAVNRIALIETVTVDTGDPGFDAAPAIRYQLGDHLGSCVLELDEHGAPISYEEYHPYGTTAIWMARGAASVSTKRYRYTGKEKDDETGLYYYGSRYYACWLGRWTCPDPGGPQDGVNLFMYVRGNPIRLVDPNGQDGKEKNAEQIAADQIRAAVHMDPTEYVLSLGKPYSMVYTRDLLIEQGKLHKDGSPTDPAPPPPPPPDTHPRDPHPQPRMEIRASTHDEIVQADAAQRAEYEQYRREHYPTAFERHQDEMANLSKAVDPSNMGVIKAPVALVYMAAGDDVKTAQQKAAVVDQGMNMAALVAATRANSVTETKWGADVPDQADPHGSPVIALDERAAYLEQRAASRKAGQPKVTSNRKFDVMSTLTRTQPVTDARGVAAAQAAAAEYRQTGSASLAGTEAHDQMGYAGSQQGVDEITGPTLMEFKAHFGTSVSLGTFQLSMRGADRQTLEAQVHLQEAAIKAGRPQLVKIRIQRHMFIDPRTNQAVQVSK
ncbi:SpvB/TcaC N-terminal domain-containing protein [Actinospica robiniae]|uniref:SpvB/TcaC N-terminal domain-containing protein n=1 Tax=Actinospica robiniae TaxID=304901 RepID=UPI0003F6B734|nr:SpvB/TcaC N-terminal domain-containing protein [Actinospica robiniae]